MNISQNFYAILNKKWRWISTFACLELVRYAANSIPGASVLLQGLNKDDEAEVLFTPVIKEDFSNQGSLDQQRVKGIYYIFFGGFFFYKSDF